MRTRGKREKPRSSRITPLVFKGIAILFLAQGLRIPAAFFFKTIRFSSEEMSMVGFAAIMFIMFIIINLVAIWATRPAAERGVWPVGARFPRRRRAGKADLRASAIDTGGR